MRTGILEFRLVFRRHEGRAHPEGNLEDQHGGMGTTCTDDQLHHSDSIAVAGPVHATGPSCVRRSVEQAVLVGFEAGDE